MIAALDLQHGLVARTSLYEAQNRALEKQASVIDKDLALTDWDSAMATLTYVITVVQHYKDQFNQPPDSIQEPTKSKLTTACMDCVFRLMEVRYQLRAIMFHRGKSFIDVDRNEFYKPLEEQIWNILGKMEKHWDRVLNSMVDESMTAWYR